MPMGPWHDGDGNPPAQPCIVLTRGQGETWDWWRYWDGRHWSRGWITEATAQVVYRRLIESGGLMRREQRTRERVIAWRAYVDDAAA